MKTSKHPRPGARPTAWLVFFTGALLASCSLRDGASARRSPGARPPAGSLLDPAGADAADAEGLEWPSADLEPAPYDPSKFPSPPEPIFPPSGVGSSPGSFAVADDGAATYSIPLHVVPGRAGIQPQLAISYNSGGGNGYLGVGMSIAGLSAVSRCASNERDDGVTHGPELDETDRFCLDGRRLVVTKGEYGAEGAEYRTVPDSFAKIVSHGAAGYRGPRSFTVYDRQGKIREYGTGPGAAVTVGDRVRQWSLSQVRDRSGNAMYYEYEAWSITETTTAWGEITYVTEQRPSAIRYTSHDSGRPADRRVVFDYDPEPRPDPLIGYGLGLRKSLTRRLRTVRAYGPGDHLAHEYRFSYGQSEGTGRSVLESMTACAPSGCLRPTTFRWASGYAGFVHYDRLEVDAPPISAAQGIATLLPLDVDGDGREDMVYPDETGWNILFSRPDIEGRYPYTTVTRASAVNNGFGGQHNLWLKGLPLDYDGDGLGDLLLTDASPTWQLLRSTGTDLVNVDTGLRRPSLGGFLPNPHAQGVGVMLADVDGNGMKDILEYWGSNDNAQDHCTADPETGEWPDCRWRMRLNSGTGFGDLIDLPMMKRVEPGDAFPLDVDGDGREELMTLSGANEFYRIHWYDESKPTHFVSKPSGLGRLAGREGRALIDVNGDGLKDLVTANDLGLDDPALAHQPLLYINTGRDFRAVQPALSAPPDLPEFGGAPLTLVGAQLALALTIDYDGDGAEDLLLPYPNKPVVAGDPGTSGLTRWLLLKAENGQLRHRSIALDYEPGGSFYGDFALLAAQGPRAVDYNGDGYRDFVGIVQPGGKLAAHTHDPGGEAKADVVVAIDDGAAAYAAQVPDVDKIPTVEIEYAHLLEGSAYRQRDGAPCVYPCQLYAGPKHVVKMHRFGGLTPLDQAVQGLSAFAEVRHVYAAARVDRLGRCWLGFRSHLERELYVEHGTETRTILRKTIYDNLYFDKPTQSFPGAGRPELRLTLGREACGGGEGALSCAWLSSDVAFPAARPLHGGKTYSVEVNAGIHGEYDRLPEAYLLEGRLSLALTLTDLFGGSEWPPAFSELVWDAAHDDFGNATSRAWSVNGSFFEVPGYHSSSVKRTYLNDEEAWLIGLPLLTTLRDRTPEGESTRVSETFYDEKGLPRRVTVATLAETDHWLDTVIERDDFGNVEHVSTTDAAGRRRQQAFTYEPDGVFLHAARNALGHTAYVKYDAALGVMVESVDAKGLRTRVTYDEFGEVRTVERPDGSALRRILSREIMGDEALVSERVTYPGGGSSLTRYDRLGRPLYALAQSIDGREHETRRSYRPEGQVSVEFLPTFAGQAPPGKTTYAYDTKGRLRQVDFADATKQLYNYIGLSASFTDQRGNLSFTTANQRGQVVRSTDAEGSPTTFHHGPFGTLASVADSKGNRHATSYDAYGRALRSVDPDAGESSMRYDAFGQLVYQRDANGREFHFEHDVLGRTRRARQFRGSGAFLEQETNYGYDAGGGSALGEATSVATFRPESAGSWHNLNYRYDALGRIRQIDHVLPTPEDPAVAEQLRFELQYDAFSRLARVNYPAVPGAAPFAVEYAYSDFGPLRSVREAGATTPFWRASVADEAGRVLHDTFGNGVLTQRSFEPTTGRLSTLGSSVASPTQGAPAVVLQSLRYLYDANGNLSDRIDDRQGRAEHFTYDVRDRLKTGKLAGTAAPRYEYRYDDLGNIKYQAGVGDYTYDPVRPHVLATVNGLAYGHDAVGNQTERPGNVVLTYDAHDKPVRITQNGLEVASFVYDGLGTRARKATLHEVTTYAGELYERHEKEDGSVEHILRVAAAGRTVAEVVFQADAAGATPARSERYLHPDHLGSPDVITGKGGTLLERRSYSPFGQRRSPNWANTGPAPAPLTTGEGFTGHEEDDEVGLVYMKGRTYDPKLGRFLQIDPFVQAPTFSQSWNPYAYVLNNPLTLVDPSGYASTDTTRCKSNPNSPGCGGPTTDPPQTVTPPSSPEEGQGGAEGAGQSSGPPAPREKATLPDTPEPPPPPVTLPHTFQDNTWTFERGGGAPEAGRERSDGGGRGAERGQDRRIENGGEDGGPGWPVPDAGSLPTLAESAEMLGTGLLVMELMWVLGPAALELVGGEAIAGAEVTATAAAGARRAASMRVRTGVKAGAAARRDIAPSPRDVARTRGSEMVKAYKREDGVGTSSGRSGGHGTPHMRAGAEMIRQANQLPKSDPLREALKVEGNRLIQQGKSHNHR